MLYYTIFCFIILHQNVVHFCVLFHLYGPISVWIYMTHAYFCPTCPWFSASFPTPLRGTCLGCARLAGSCSLSLTPKDGTCPAVLKVIYEWIVWQVYGNRWPNFWRFVGSLRLKLMKMTSCMASFGVLVQVVDGDPFQTVWTIEIFTCVIRCVFLISFDGISLWDFLRI